MSFNGQKLWAPYGDPNIPPSPPGPSDLGSEDPRYISLGELSMNDLSAMLPIRPNSSVSNVSSRSISFASQISYDGGVRLPTLTVVNRQIDRSTDVGAIVPIGVRPQASHGTNAFAGHNSSTTDHSQSSQLPAYCGAASGQGSQSGSRFGSRPTTYGTANVSGFDMQTRYNTEPSSQFSHINFNDQTPARHVASFGHGSAFEDPFLHDLGRHRAHIATAGHDPRHLSGFAHQRAPASSYMYDNSGHVFNNVVGYASGPSTAQDGTSRGRRHSRGMPSLSSYELQQQYQQAINQAQTQPLNISESQRYRAPAPAHPAQTHARRHSNQVNAYQPYALPPPAPASQALVISPANASRARGASLAADIRKGVFDDGQPLDPDFQTPSKAAHHRRTNSVQSTTPSRGKYSGRGRKHSFASNATATPQNMQMIQFDKTPTRGAPDHLTLAERLLPGETVPPPDWFGEGKMPNLEQAMASIPFADPTAGLRVKSRGVIKLENISFKTTKNEILAFLGPDAEVVRMPEGSPYFEVHIIMDRSTGKSGAAFIVMSTLQEAWEVVISLQRRAATKGLKLGVRDISAQVSSLEHLMTALFPYAAASVEWSGSTPRVIESDDEAPGTKFRGFCGSEELAMMAKNAENPTRSQYVANVRNRTYECMISTLHKFPWHMSQYITLDNRKKLYETVLACVRTLVAFLKDKVRYKIRDQPQMTTELLTELVVAALSCPGFSELQKSSLVTLLNSQGYSGLTTGRVSSIFLGGSGPSSANWPFLALSPKAAVKDEFLKLYAALIRQAVGTRGVDVDFKLRPFGNLPIVYGSTDLSGHSIAEIAKIERNAVVSALRGYLSTGVDPSFKPKA